MTAGLPKRSACRAISQKNPGWVAFGILSVFCLLLILRNSDIAIRHMSHGLRLCATTVVPSLFPFMVISELIVSSGAIRAVGGLIAPPCRKLFGISAESASAVILGMLCGFPIGAKSAVSLYKKGRIDLDELEHVLTFSNNPSSAFLISAVGVSMFGSRSFGVLLYTISIISAVFVGIAGGMLRGRNKAAPPTEAKRPTNTPASKAGISAFTSAVTSSALSMLNVCAFVVFFSALVGTLESILSPADLPDGLLALGFAFFELTSGVWRAASAGPLGAYICAFAVGWSGLSVHFQIMSLCTVEGLSFKPYIFSKIAQGVSNVLLLYLYSLLFGMPIS